MLAIVSRSFNHSAQQYLEQAYGGGGYPSLQAQAATLLQKSLPHIKHGSSFDRVLDLGCGPGAQTEELNKSAHHYVGVDIAAEMLRVARMMHPATDFIQADMHRLPFQPRQFDLAYANLSMQWHDDLQALVTDLARVLMPEGTLAFSTLLSGSMPQLNALWRIGVIRGVNQYPDADAWTHALTTANFNIPVSQMASVATFHESPKALLQSLKGIGATAMQHRFTQQFGLRGKRWLRDLYEAIEEVCYDPVQKQYRLDYELGIFIGKMAPEAV
ncbi:MAG: malonyl-CoA O-methyltransferase BioC [Idiomarinaceae bacterium HL-53]|nr:MAG: malonyl-CoA O-methyltransferase BioC [Idiomarinaceae bacterium HL-53]CUS48960.1 malonyl-CoA O-methyltransferase [Idiomarinaceae bacterium HL-53]